MGSSSQQRPPVTTSSILWTVGGMGRVDVQRAMNGNEVRE